MVVTLLVTGNQETPNLEISQVFHLVVGSQRLIVEILQILHEGHQSLVMIFTGVVEPKLVKMFDVSHHNMEAPSFLEQLQYIQPDIKGMNQNVAYINIH